MITQFLITASEWTAISPAGGSGSCWLDDDKEGFAGHVDVRIIESADGVPSVSAEVGRRVYPSSGNSDRTIFSAGNARGILYARCLTAGDGATICVGEFIGYQREMDVNVQSQVGPPFQYFLMQELNDTIVLTAPVAIDAVTLPVSPGHGFVVGNYVTLWEGNGFTQQEVISVAGDNIGIGLPLSRPFTTAAVVVRGNITMNVDGSVTPVEFKLRIRSSIVPVDISFGVLSMVHAAEASDEKFGGITALTNGLYFRKSGTGGIGSFGNHKSNRSFRDRGWAVTYYQRVGGGNYATECRLDTRAVYSVEIRLDPRTSDILKVVVRDNLTTMAGLVVSALGSFTSGE